MVIWTWIIVRAGESEVAAIQVVPLELVEDGLLVEVDLKHATEL
jgi:hypothetical protein